MITDGIDTVVDYSSYRRRLELLFRQGQATIAENYKNGIQRIPRTLWELEVPVIAAVNGAAYGAGCDLTPPAVSCSYSEMP